MFDLKQPSRFLPIFIACLLCTASLAFSDVSQKRFDFKKTSAPKTEQVAPDSAASEVKVSQDAASVKTSSSYFFIGSDALWNWLISSQKSLREKISTQTMRLRNGETKSLGIFLLVCFIYGLVHAIGPGHGKTIVASYFLARRGSFLQGVGLGSSITIIHTLSAVILLFALYGIAKATLFPIFEMSRIHIETASYALIVLTGLLLIAISIREATGKKRDAFEGAENASWKELLWLAFITGIVPCPAVALVVFFCLLNELPGIALCGAFAIGLGMAVTNTSFGFGAILVRRGIDTGIHRMGKLKRYAVCINAGISMLCGLCILLLGVFLLMNVR